MTGTIHIAMTLIYTADTLDDYQNMTMALESAVGALGSEHTLQYDEVNRRVTITVDKDENAPWAEL